MKKHLFFDDNKLFVRENVKRKYGDAELVSIYRDPIGSTDFCTGNIFKLDNGKFRLMYFAHSESYSGKRFFSAISDDGVNFSPEDLTGMRNDDGLVASHEVMLMPPHSEIACIYEDKHCDNPAERYKMLLSECVPDEICVIDHLYTSPDLISWSLMEGVAWGNGTEPLASVFYNEKDKMHTIIERPYWGMRCAGYKRTGDWRSYSDYQFCLNVDSLDEPLSEIYGMKAFAYDGMYIGLVHIYRGLTSELEAKYKNGIIDVQLAYSLDGKYWQRSLREPFMSGLIEHGGIDGKHHYMLWLSDMRVDGDYVYLYGSASELEHGPAFSTPGTGKILVYRMRRDGFIPFVTENNDEPSLVATREKIWHGGEIHVGLRASHATVAVYSTEESENVVGNVLGTAKPIDGYTHEDCVPVSGSFTDWVPEYTTGRRVDELKGKTLVFEVKFNDGELYSLAGDYTDVYNVPAARYRKTGEMPE